MVSSKRARFSTPSGSDRIITTGWATDIR